MYRDIDDRPAPPAGGGQSLGDMLARPIGAVPAVIWCMYCTEPAIGDTELCGPHGAGVPAAITDPWLAASFAQGLARRKVKR